VTIDKQKDAIERIRKINGATADGKSTGNGRTMYASETGTPVATVLHPGAHLLPPRARLLIVDFFKAHEEKI
jgi:hypothetical protein